MKKENVVKNSHAELAGGAPRSSASSTLAVKSFFPEVVVGELPLLNKENLIGKQQTPDNGFRGKNKEEALNKNAFGVPLRFGFTCPCHPVLDTGSRRSFRRRPELVSVSRRYDNERFHIKCGMTLFHNNAANGFTLIELLVVVLIIGILAAVALPQYQKAVARTRLSNLKNLTNAIAHAQEVYYMENNAYATKFSELVVQMPEGTPNEDDNVITYSWGKCTIDDANNSQCEFNGGIAFLAYHEVYDREYRGQRMCQADKGTIYEQVCKADTGDTSCLNWGAGGSRPTCRYK